MGRMSNTIILALFLASAVGASAQDKERKLTTKELPVAVLSAFQKAYPTATIKGVAEEKKDGKTYFEIESRDGKTSRDLLYEADGTVSEMEEGIALSELPEAAKSAVMAKYPKGKLIKAEKVTKGFQVSYDVEVKTGKRKLEVDVDASGKFLKE